MTEYRILEQVPGDHIILAERVLEDIRKEEMTDPSKVMIALAISNTHASIANAQLNQSLVNVLEELVAIGRRLENRHTRD